MAKENQNKKELENKELNKVEGGAIKYQDVNVPDNPDPTIDPTKVVGGETNKSKPHSFSLYRPY